MCAGKDQSLFFDLFKAFGEIKSIIYIYIDIYLKFCWQKFYFCECMPEKALKYDLFLKC